MKAPTPTELLFALSTFLLLPAQSTTTEDLSIQAGYHVIYSYSGLTAPSHLLDLTRQGKVGGLILFADNIGSTTSSVISSFQSAYAQSPGYSGLPLLITTDQEGGEVRRVPGGPDLSAKAIGLSSNPSKAATQAGGQAYEALHPLGINGNLAPVLDVYRRAGDFEDQYERSYGNTSALVSLCGSSFIKSQQAAGVIATAKHFPGLGPAAAAENTDERPVTVNLTLDQLRAVDEEPYRQAIAEGVGMVMTSWALYPALDKEYPAGISKAWIQGELRGRLGFKGVTISDAIEAGGLSGFGNDAQRAVLASSAGLDIVLAAAGNATQGEAIVDALVVALNSGSLPRASFDAATQRIKSLRSGIAI
ncbi:MAG: hypothetical protein MMC23_005420 [Stictis urceolatum]|nr:hypothetical protein [Stictis urceolata]